MADNETKLINKLVTTGGAEQLISGGVSEEHFLDQENLEIWEFINSYIRQYKSSPRTETITEKFPNRSFEIQTEPINYIKDQFIADVSRREGIRVFEEIGQVLDDNDYKDISHIGEIFLEKSKELSEIIPSTNISKFSEMKQRIDLYRAKKKEGVKPGMSFPFPKLNEVTLGLQSHEYVSIVGSTGLGKSTLGFLFAIHHYLEGHTPMIVSLEMDEDEVHRKLDAFAVGLKQHTLKALELSPNDMEEWEEFSEKVDKVSNDIIIIDVDFATPEKIYAETTKWNPDVVIVDYVQLMLAPKHIKSTWEQISYISKMLKAQTRQLGIPMYGLAQTNAEGFTEGAKLSNIGGSKDIGRHSDIVLGLHQDEEMRANKKMRLGVEKNRGGQANISIDLFWDQANSEFRQWKLDDIWKTDNV